MVFWIIGIFVAFAFGYMLCAIMAAGAKSDEIHEKWMEEKG